MIQSISKLDGTPRGTSRSTFKRGLLAGVFCCLTLPAGCLSVSTTGQKYVHSGVDLDYRIVYNKGIRLKVHDEDPTGEFHEWHPAASFNWIWTWPQLDIRRQMDT